MPTKRELEALKRAKDKKDRKRSKKSRVKTQVVLEPKPRVEEPKRERKVTLPPKKMLPDVGPRPGQPTLLNQKRQDIIVEAIAGGATARSACKSAGIDEHTMVNWIKRGKDGIEPYLTFFTAIEQAKAAYEEFTNRVSENAIKNIAAKIEAGDVKISMWWIERVRPDIFSGAKVVNNQVVSQEAKVAAGVSESRLVLTQEHIEALGKTGLENIVGKEVNLLALIED